MQVDSLNGPPGIILAGAKGALRCLLMNPKSNFEAIPVDTAINGLIMVAKQLATQPRYRVFFPLIQNLFPHASSPKIRFNKFTRFVKYNFRSKEIPVINITQHKSRRITYGYFFDVANDMKFEIPCMVSLW
jgi:fatty acyl-CoA reductase